MKKLLALCLCVVMGAAMITGCAAPAQQETTEVVKGTFRDLEDYFSDVKVRAAEDVVCKALADSNKDNIKAVTWDVMGNNYIRVVSCVNELPPQDAIQKEVDNLKKALYEATLIDGITVTFTISVDGSSEPLVVVAE